MRTLLALTLAALSAAAQERPRRPAPPPAEAKKPEYVALVGGDVVTVTRGVFKGATVLVKDGRIHRVGHEIELPEGTVRHDVAGKRVLPGFIAADARGLGVGTVSSGGKVADSLDPYQEPLKMALAAGITAAYVEPGGGFGGRSESSGGPSAVVRPAYGDLEKMLVLEPAAVSLSGWVSGGASRRQQIRDQLVKAREQLEKIRDYERRRAEQRLQPNEQPPPAADPFVKLLRGETIARINASSEEQIRSALALVNEFKLRAALVDVDEGWVLADEIGRARAWCILTPRNKRAPDRNVSRPSGSTIEQAAILRKAGVKFAVATLSPAISTGGIAGRDLASLPLEAAFAIRGGLDEQAALEAITITAAEILGVDHRLGSIEEGKDADLIVLDGDPFDFRTYVELAFIEGKLFYRKDATPYFNHLKPQR